MDWAALWLTCKLALVTACLLTLLGVPIAWWLANTRSRLRVPVEAIVALPLVLPPTVIGFYVLILLGPRTAVGQLLSRMLGHPLPFTFWGLVFASVLYSLPFAVQPFAVALRTVEASLLEAARGCGATRWQSIRLVGLPLAAPGLISGFVLSFAHTLGEFGVVLMVGGNIPGSTRTVSIAIYDSVQAMDYAAANKLALLLLLMAFTVLCLTYRLQRYRQLSSST